MLAAVYFHSLADEAGDNDTSILRTVTAWKTITTGVYQTVVKMPRFDIEAFELEITNTTALSGIGTKTAVDWTHAFFEIDNNDSLVYKITGIRQGRTFRNGNNTEQPIQITESVQNGTILVSFQIDMLATYWVNAGLSGAITGRWSRLPLPSLGPIEPFQIRPAQMMKTSSVDVPSNLPTMAYAPGLGTADLELHDLIYVQINYVDGSTLHTRLYVASLQAVEYGVYALTSSGGRTPFPSLQSLLMNTNTGITTSTITSINVSNRCPYHFVCGTTVQHSDPGLYILYTSRQGSDQVLEAQRYTPSAGTTYAYYEINRGVSVTGLSSVNALATDMLYSETLEMTITLAQTYMGYFSVRDGGKNIVGSIDTRYTEPITGSTNKKLSVNVQTISDGMNLYTELTLNDGTIIRYPEGNIPFAGDAYKEYSIAQMAYDREMLAINQERVKTNAVTGIVASLTNGAIASIGNGGLGAATAGVGAIGTAIETVSSLRLTEKEQEAKEKLMRDTPDNAYQTGYGYSSVINILRSRPASIELNYPAGITDAELTYFTRSYGYPVTDYQATVPTTDIYNATEGFLKMLRLDQVTIWRKANGGEYRRIFAKQLKNGIHYKVMT